jgi:hypothetical protein
MVRSLPKAMVFEGDKVTCTTSGKVAAIPKPEHHPKKMSSTPTTATMKVKIVLFMAKVLYGKFVFKASFVDWVV